MKKQRKKRDTQRRQLQKDIARAQVRGKNCEFCGAERAACLCGFNWRGVASPEEAKERIIAYFKTCAEGNKPLTMSGLANVLGVSRNAMALWKFKGGPWGEVFEAARRAVEQFAEEALYEKKYPVAGVIFSLVNSHAWSNRQEFKFDDTQTVFGPMILLPEKKPEGAPASLPQHAESVDTPSHSS